MVGVMQRSRDNSKGEGRDIAVVDIWKLWAPHTWSACGR